MSVRTLVKSIQDIMRQNTGVDGDEKPAAGCKAGGQVFRPINLRELAGVLGKSHATINKTPESKNLQPALQPFEEILRGRLLVDGDYDLFRQWLNTASGEFLEQDGKKPTPMDIIRMGHPEVVAGMVDQELQTREMCGLGKSKSR